MCITAILGLAGAAISAGAQRRAGDVAANAQQEASRAQIASNERMYEQQRADALAAEERARGYLQPYTTAGTAAQGAISYELGLGAKPVNYQGFTATPGYDFRVRQGQEAIEASAAARGNLFSGAAGKELAQFGQDIGSAEYGNYYNRLSGVAANGQSAAAGLGGNAMNTAGSVAQYGASMTQNNNNALAQGANATGAAAVNRANAFGNFLNNGLNIYGYMQGQGQSKPLFGGNSWG